MEHNLGLIQSAINIVTKGFLTLISSIILILFFKQQQLELSKVLH